MTDEKPHERIDTRLERKLTIISDNVNGMREKLIELEVVLKNHDDRSSKNEAQIEKLKGNVDTLKSQIHRMDGSVGTLKWFGGFSIGFLISFGVWLNQSVHDLNKRAEKASDEIRIIREINKEQMENLRKNVDLNESRILEMQKENK